MDPLFRHKGRYEAGKTVNHYAKHKLLLDESQKVLGPDLVLVWHATNQRHGLWLYYRFGFFQYPMKLNPIIRSVIAYTVSEDEYGPIGSV